MRTIKKVIPSQNEDETISEDVLISPEKFGKMSNKPSSFGIRADGSLHKMGWYLADAKFNDMEFEVVRDSQNAQILICKKVKS